MVMRFALTFRRSLEQEKYEAETPVTPSSQRNEKNIAMLHGTDNTRWASCAPERNVTRAPVEPVSESEKSHR